MTSQSKIIQPIPRETLRSAKAVFGAGNFYIRVGDHLKTILDEIRLDYFAGELKNSLSGRTILPFVTYFEFIEGLTDFQAVDAVRTRMDWKYALHLPMNPPTLHRMALCEFRRVLLADTVRQHEFQKLVDRINEFNSPTDKQPKTFGVLDILSEICSINRLTWIQQAMYEALGAVAGKSPDWLRRIALPHWYGKFSNLSFGSNQPMSINQQELAIQKLGEDVHYLLKEVRRSNLNEINEIREIQALQQIWELQYEKPSLEPPKRRETHKQHGCNACINFAM